MIRYFLIGVVMLSTGCASLQLPIKTPQVTPDTVLSVLGMLQDTAIEANNRKELSDNSTRVIVKFVVDSAKVIKTAPASTNWKTIVNIGLTQLFRDLPVIDANKFSSILLTLQGVVK